MKHFISLLLSLFLVSCGSDQKRNADLVVEYEGKVVYTASSVYDTEEQVKNKLNDSIKPDFVIFSATWCPSCKLLLQFLQETGLKNKVIMLNLDEKWVQYIAVHTGVKSVPAMMVTSDGGNTIVPIIYGPVEIAKAIIDKK